MTTSESSQPEDYSGLVETQGKARNYLFYIVIIAFVLVLVVYLLAQSPEQEIVLEAPMSQESIDPSIGAKQAALEQSVPAGKADEQNQVAPSADPPKVELAAMSRKVSHSVGETDDHTTPLGAGDTARSLIKSLRQGEQNLNMEQLFGQASELQQQAMSTDAYLLYFYAARKGHGPSAFALAAMHDPAYFEAGSDLLDNPDPVQAYKWYSIAAEKNVAGSGERLQTLRNSIEVAAADGDLGAQRLLLNWK